MLYVVPNYYSMTSQWTKTKPDYFTTHESGMVMFLVACMGNPLTLKSLDVERSFLVYRCLQNGQVKCMYQGHWIKVKKQKHVFMCPALALNVECFDPECSLLLCGYIFGISRARSYIIKFSSVSQEQKVCMCILSWVVYL